MVELLLMAYMGRHARKIWSPDGKVHFGDLMQEGSSSWYWRRGVEYADHWEEVRDCVAGYSPALTLVLKPAVQK